MAIDGFDYKEFAASMVQQASEIVPEDISSVNKKYLLDTLQDFTCISGEALYNDDSLDFDAQQACFVAQVVAEWTFHKIIDLAHSDIPKEFWDSILQKIAFTAYEIAKHGIITQIEQNELLQAIEHNVIKAYNESLEELKEKDIISDETLERAEALSSIDDYAKAAADKADREAVSQTLKVTQNSLGQGNKALGFALKMANVFQKISNIFSLK